MDKLKKIFAINSLLFLLAADLLIKYYIKTKLVSELFIIKKSFLILAIKYVENPYLAFSLKLPLNAIIIGSTVVILMLIGALIYAYRKKDYKLAALLTLVIIGALSNLIDRLVYGFVVDYISITILNTSLSVFNLADLMIIVGVFTWTIKCAN